MKHMPKITFVERMTLLLGKLRRFNYGHFNMAYMEAKAHNRVGECRRCGACCKLGIYCPALNENVDPFECFKYDRRSLNCRLFPIDEKDLSDRDIINKNQKCGFRFV